MPGASSNRKAVGVHAEARASELADERSNKSGCGRDQAVADLYLVGELATEKLIDQASNFRFIAEELTERASVEGERPNVALGYHCRCGRLFGQERHLADEVASFQMRHFAVGDRHSDAASANEGKPLERLVLFGQRRAIGKIAKLAGGEQTRDLRIVETGKDTAQQVAIGLGWRSERRSCKSR